MAIYGQQGRMGAYNGNNSEENNNAGSLFGRLLGGIGASLKDDKGLFQGNKDGSIRIGKQEGLDRPDSGLFQENEDGSMRLGAYRGLDINKGRGHSGDFEGIDFLQDNKGFVQGGKFVNPYKGRYRLDGMGSKIRQWLTKNKTQGPTQPEDNSLSGAVERTEENIKDAPNQNVVVNQETGQNYGNSEVMGPLLAAKVNDPSQVPPRHAGMMQKFLNSQGFKLEEDGKWGPKSTEAMRTYMTNNGLLQEPEPEFYGPFMPRIGNRGGSRFTETSIPMQD